MFTFKKQIVKGKGKSFEPLRIDIKIDKIKVGYILETSELLNFINEYNNVK